jgi:cytohesin
LDNILVAAGPETSPEMCLATMRVNHRLLESSLRALAMQKADPRALCVAAAAGSTAAVKALLAAGAQPDGRARIDNDQDADDDITFGDEMGAADIAARLGHLGVLKALVAGGANVSVHCRGNAGVALALAVRHGRMAVIRYLLGAGALGRDMVLLSDSCSPLHQAIRQGRNDLVRRLADAGHPLDVPPDVLNDEEYMGDYMALGCACACKNLEAVGLLLRAGADAALHNGRTALHVAAGCDFAAAVPLLVAAGAQVDAVANMGDADFDWQMCTPTRYAILEGHAATLRALLQAGAAPGQTNAAGSGLLHTAARCGRLEMVHVLLEAGASVATVENDSEMTALHAAVQHSIWSRLAREDSRALTARLIEAGSDVELMCTYDNQLMSPLDLAVRFENAGAVEALLAGGADVDRAEERTSIVHAIREGRVEMMRLLLDGGANPHQVDSQGWSLLHHAARCDKPAAARLLLDAGCDVDVLDKDKHTPLHYAAGWLPKGASTALVLLEAGAGVDAQAENGRTPLHVAAMGGKVAVAELLVAKGASVARADADGMTALHFAAARGEVDFWARRHADPGLMTSFLLRAGSDLECVTAEGLTPLALAAKHNKSRPAEVLLAAGAAVDGDGDGSSTAIAQAVDASHAEMVAMLLDNGAALGRVDAQGWGLLHRAARVGVCAVLRVLLDRGLGVDVCVLGSNATPLMVAAQRGHAAAAAALLQRGAAAGARDAAGKTALELAQESGQDAH